MLLRNDVIYYFDFDSASIEHPMFDAITICDRMDFWKVKSSEVEETLRYLDRFINEYNKYGYLSDSEVSAFFSCLAVRHYRLHGCRSQVPIKGSSYMTEQWFTNLMSWMYDFRELTEKRSLL